MKDIESTQDQLLTEIADLLRPISDHFRPAYERRQAIRALIGTSAARRKAWELLDGKRAQREIAKASGMNEGNLSRYFKALREAGAIKGDPPERSEEV
jgi:hypothetical protein